MIIVKIKNQKAPKTCAIKKQTWIEICQFRGSSTQKYDKPSKK